MEVRTQPITIDRYQYHETDVLGKGYSSVVYRGSNTTNGELVAIKVVDLRQLKDELHRELLRNQVECLRRLANCDNVVRILDYITTAASTSIVMELCERGDLASLRKQSPSMTDEEVVEIMKQLISGYRQLWKAGIVHRDLKPANIFIKGKTAKIADFGFATDASKCGQPCGFNIGSPSYMSPEALRRNQYSFQSDVWALGVIAFELLYGKLPWRTDNDLFLYQMLVNDPIQDIMNKERPASEIVKDFIVGCCSPSLRTRMKPEDVVDFDWSGNTVRKSFIATRPPGGLHQYMRQFKNKSTQQLQQPPPVTFPSSNVHSPRSNSVATKQTAIIPVSLDIKIAPNTLRNIPFANAINMPPKEVVPTKKLTPVEQVTTQPPPEQKATITSKTECVIPAPTPNGKEQAQESLMSQLHYCRFLNLLLGQASLQPATLAESLKLELLGRISLLHAVVTEKSNSLLLNGFDELISDGDRFSELAMLVGKYHQRYNDKYNPNGNLMKFTGDSSELEGLLMSAIKALVREDQQLLLVDRLTTLLQLKQLERRTDYNRFGEDSKIEMLMERAAAPPAGNSLLFRLQVLGIC